MLARAIGAGASEQVAPRGLEIVRLLHFALVTTDDPGLPRYDAVLFEPSETAPGGGASCELDGG